MFGFSGEFLLKENFHEQKKQMREGSSLFIFLPGDHRWVTDLFTYPGNHLLPKEKLRSLEINVEYLDVFSTVDDTVSHTPLREYRHEPQCLSCGPCVYPALKGLHTLGKAFLNMKTRNLPKSSMYVHCRKCRSTDKYKEKNKNDL